jgi:uncharacterized protein YggU (UPF0235/DUF167 family)
MERDDHPLIQSFKEKNIKISNPGLGGAGELSFNINVVAKPGSKVEKISITPLGEIKIHLMARPIEGAANKSIIKILSKKLGISKSSIVFLKGEKSSSKTFQLFYSFTAHKDIKHYQEKLAGLI